MLIMLQWQFTVPESTSGWENNTCTGTFSGTLSSFRGDCTDADGVKSDEHGIESLTQRFNFWIHDNSYARKERDIWPWGFSRGFPFGDKFDSRMKDLSSEARERIKYRPWEFLRLFVKALELDHLPLKEEHLLSPRVYDEI